MAGAAMGLAHWYTVTVLAAFVVAALLLRGRRALPLVLTGTVAALPTVALVVLNLLNGTGARNAEHLHDTDGALPDLAVTAWSGGDGPLLYLTVGLGIVGAVRAACGWSAPRGSWSRCCCSRPPSSCGRCTSPATCWPACSDSGCSPRPGRSPHRGPPRAGRWPRSSSASRLLTAEPLAHREPRERADEVVRLLADVQRPGEPIVAADQRSATGLDHYVRSLEPDLRPDLVLPPDDAPSGADRVWLVRRLFDGSPEAPTDDDEILRDGRPAHDPPSTTSPRRRPTSSSSSGSAERRSARARQRSEPTPPSPISAGQGRSRQLLSNVCSMTWWC